LTNQSRQPINALPALTKMISGGRLSISSIMVRLIQSLLIASTLFLGGCDWWRTYHFPLKEGERLDQSLAIRLSQEVISQAGYHPNDFELFPIREDGAPGERYFGTGPALPPHGYVMWRHKAPGTGRRGLTVTIEQRDQVAVCKLSWWP